MRVWVFISVFLLGLGAPAKLRASPSDTNAAMLPPLVQVALFHKIFAYDRKLPPRLRVLVVYTEEYATVAEEVAKNLTKLPMNVDKSHLSEFARRSSGANVVYLLTGKTPPSVMEFCQRNQVLSVSPIPALAERGEVSVAIGIREDRKSEIIVHLNRARQEGRELTMGLLALARVIR